VENRKLDINEINFLKKIKVMSKSHTTLTVPALKPPKMKTDVYMVDKMRLLKKSETELTKYQKEDWNQTKISTPFVMDWTPIIEQQQTKEGNLQFTVEKKHWQTDLLKSKKSELSDALHH